MLKNLTLILLAGLIAGASMVAAADPVVLDRSKPIQVDLWSAPPDQAAWVKSGVDPKVKQSLCSTEPSQAYQFPMLIGCVLTGGEIHRPFAVPYEQCNCTDHGLFVAGGNCMYRYFGTRLLKEDLLEFSCKLEAISIHGRSKSNYGGPESIDVEWAGKVDGDKIVGVMTMILKDGKRLERPMIGLLRNTANIGLDPMNAIYQFEREVQGQPHNRMYQHAIVVEVANGKSVAAMAYRKGSTTLVEVDASGMTIIPQPMTISGRSAIVGGTLVVGGKTLTLEPILVSPNGFVTKEIGAKGIWYGLSGVHTRVYPNTDPVAKRWKEGMSATFTGPMELPTEMNPIVARETAELEALPSPGPATAFTHYHLVQGSEKSPKPSERGNEFLYPPWFNFQPVAGADHYQFKVQLEEEYRNKRSGKSSTFAAISPTASLRPVWKDLTILGVYAVICTAMDASDKPMGEPQKWLFGKKLAFGEGKNLSKPIPDPMATQLALRFPRTLANQHYGYYPLFELVLNAGMSPRSERMANSIRNANLCLLKWSDQPSELTAANGGALSFYWRNLRDEPDEAMGFSSTYYGQYFGTVQTWARQVMNDYEVTGKSDRISKVQSVLAKLSRIQQPSGSWTFIPHPGGWPNWKGGFTSWKNSWLDHNSGPYTLGYGRYRRLSGDSQFMDAELKANHWLARNALRTGWWERQIQNGDPSSNRPTIPIHAHDYLLYLLEHAPAQVADLSLAEDLTRFIEDQFVDWGTRSPLPSFNPSGFPNQDDGHLRMAIIWLHLYRKTGNPIYFAKAEAFFSAYMQSRDPVEGLRWMNFNRYTAEEDEPWNAFRYLELRRQIQAEKSTMPNAANSPMVVTLYNAAEGRERVVLYLDCQAGKVVRVMATTPTWHQIDIPFTEPGRLHHHEQTMLYHNVNADKLTVGANGIQGEVTVMLTPPILGAPTTSTTFILDAHPDARMLRGTWTSGKATGRISSEIREPAKNQPKRFNLEIGKAVAGGEAWQNWALAQFDLKDPKTATASLGNNNAGWRTRIETCDAKISRETVTATMKATVTWNGIMDNNAPKEAKIAEWKAGNLDWLAYWTIGRPGDRADECIYEPKIRPFPWPEHTRSPGKMVDSSEGITIPEPWPKDTPIETIEAQGGQLEYKTTFKPVVAGTYEYQFEGKRVGDVIAGTVTVTSPDGKKTTTQCFGSVE